jgi:hypothetical protein
MGTVFTIKKRWQVVSAKPCIATFRSSLLDDVEPGTVTLRVPLVDDVIPIGLGGRFATCRLVISKSRRDVRIGRADGRPIQVVLITDVDERMGHRVVRRTTRQNVFRRSVSELALVRLPARAGLFGGYVVTDAVDVIDTERIKQFADVVGGFAAAKQRRTAHLR